MRHTLEDLKRRGNLRYALAIGLCCGGLMVGTLSVFDLAWVGLILILVLVVIGFLYHLSEMAECVRTHQEP